MSEELKMYVEYRDGKPHGYLYGPSWKAMELYMEGGYPTEEEAIAAWEVEQSKLHEEFCENCGKKRSYHVSRNKVNGVPEYTAHCAACAREMYVPTVHDMNVMLRKRYTQK